MDEKVVIVESNTGVSLAISDKVEVLHILADHALQGGVNT